jgi:uncharacterized membrane protein
MPQSAIATKRPPPGVRTLQRDDLWDVLIGGWQDFKAAPQYGLALGGLYVVGGWMLILLATAAGLHYFVYPLATGFALIAPFVAAGLYEVSRRLENGAPLSWPAIFSAVRAGGVRDLGWMALVTTFAFLIWVDIAFFTYLMFFGLKSPDPWLLIVEILSTPHGLLFLAVGNTIGAAIALFLFSITVVSFPLLLDRDVDFVTAMIVSVRAVKANKVQMISWAAMIALFLATSLLTALLSLLLTLPLIAHASWRLYRKVVEPEA